jgi:hypothetical protein
MLISKRTTGVALATACTLLLAGASMATAQVTPPGPGGALSDTASGMPVGAAGGHAALVGPSIDGLCGRRITVVVGEELHLQWAIAASAGELITRVEKLTGFPGGIFSWTGVGEATGTAELRWTPTEDDCDDVPTEFRFSVTDSGPALQNWVSCSVIARVAGGLTVDAFDPPGTVCVTEIAEVTVTARSQCPDEVIDVWVPPNAPPGVQFEVGDETNPRSVTVFWEPTPDRTSVTTRVVFRNLAMPLPNTEEVELTFTVLPPMVSGSPSEVMVQATGTNAVEFTVIGSHPCQHEDVELTGIGIPAGATWTDAAGTGTVESTFSWDPAGDQGGVYLMSFTTTVAGFTATSTTTIKVRGDPDQE